MICSEDPHFIPQFLGKGLEGNVHGSRENATHETCLGRHIEMCCLGSHLAGIVAPGKEKLNLVPRLLPTRTKTRRTLLSSNLLAFYV